MNNPLTVIYDDRQNEKAKFSVTTGSRSVGSLFIGGNLIIEISPERLAELYGVIGEALAKISKAA
jgi:hypothetical protein